jgi:hypothetical protein
VTENPQQLSDAAVKHLEFIQTVIARQAGNSFLLKGWSLTVAAALYGFTAAHLNWRLALLGLVVIAAFWWLDAYFLRQERLFRCLYDDVRKEHAGIAPFEMSTASYRSRPRNSYRACVWSITLAVFYGIVEVVGVGLLVASLYHTG